MTTTPDTLLVTGASGHLGSAVLHHLLDTLQIPAQRIVAASRKPAELSGLAARGVAVRKANFDDVAGLHEAFRGVQRLLLISTDRLDAPGVRLAQHRAAVTAAVRAGVQHVVYTSMPKPGTSLVTFAPDHAGTEAALAESALPGWTVLRNHWYFENLLHAMPGAIASGQWFKATGDGKAADISRDDLARAAAVALASGDRAKTTYTLSGTRAYSSAEVAALVSRAVGKPIRVVPVSIEDLVKGMTTHGLPEPIARVFASFDANTAAGQFGDVTTDFRKLTGRDPQPFEAWVDANKAALAGAKR
ncbi:MAG TPA: SDR family oxidoreductase [Burkholderiaceae bacterium]|nr:SDR family oxidoreductase [Burkholderiaceae bacterium]